MTAPNGPILFNSTTGSDSAASGLGPSVALIGSSAELDGTSTVDVSYDGVSLSSISVGDLLFCDTTSGRKFSIIASIDTLYETITTDDVWPTESGVSWSVGGKRATFDHADSRLLFIEEGKSGFVLETETDQSITSRIYRGNSRPFILVRGSGTSLKTLTASGDFILLDQGQSSSMSLYNLKFVGAANNSNTSHFATGGGYMRIRSCRFGDPNQNTNYLNAVRASNYDSQISIQNCDLFGQGASVSNGFGLKGQYYATRGVYASNCFIQDFYYGNYSNTHSASLSNCIITNATVGMKGDRHAVYADSCVFHNISSHAIELHSAPSSTYSRYWPVSPSLYNFFGRNVFSNVSGDVFHGDNLTTGPDETDYGFAEDFTCYLHNSSGFTGITFPSDTLTADPFTDAANGDFSLNSDAGGGATLRAVTNTMGSTTSYPFNWLTDGSGGGGGSTVHPLYAN